MKISFESSGGFANLKLGYGGDTADLPDDEREAIEHAIAESGFFELDPESVELKGAGPPDVMTYRLTISDGGRSRSVVVTDTTAPGSLRPLLGLLRKKATGGPGAR